MDPDLFEAMAPHAGPAWAELFASPFLPKTGSKPGARVNADRLTSAVITSGTVFNFRLNLTARRPKVKGAAFSVSRDRVAFDHQPRAPKTGIGKPQVDGFSFEGLWTWHRQTSGVVLASHGFGFADRVRCSFFLDLMGEAHSRAYDGIGLFVSR